jgi:bacterioferritin-associated ferredoxin
MIVCSCNAISDTKIKDSLNSEKCPRTPGAVYRCLGCSPNCGRCYAAVQSIIKQALGQAEELAHGHPAALTRFQEEWAMQPVQAADMHASGPCAAGCEGCAAAHLDPRSR